MSVLFLHFSGFLLFLTCCSYQSLIGFLEVCGYFQHRLFGWEGNARGETWNSFRG
jgi:hypothetical protein